MVHFQRTLSLYDWPANDLIAFGVYEQHHGYAADAIRQYERALKSTTDTATRAIELSNMGSAYMDLKDLNHASRSFQQALQADPKNVSALIGTGVLAQKQGNLDLAIREYTLGASIRPSDLVYVLLGLALEQSGRAVDAAAAYSRAQAYSQDLQSARAAADQLLAN